MKSLNNGWEFVPEWSEGFARGEGAGESVRLPHTVRRRYSSAIFGFLSIMPMVGLRRIIRDQATVR